MIAVSEAWKNIQTRFLLPESFIEISCGLSDVGVQDLLTVTGDNEAVFSNAQGVAAGASNSAAPKYATFEHNLWALDGSRNVIPDEAPYNNVGYVSSDSSKASITMALPEVRRVAIPGLTITWSSEYGEYPTEFSIVAKSGDVEIASTYVTGNTTNVTDVLLDLVNYDSITIETFGWSLPNHRARIDKVSFGHVVTFNKNEVISYSHEQHGDLNSAELPKHSINFALDNVDGRWNPTNPTGIGKYLSERQQVQVRYGLDVDGTTEWISAGTFYLTEWRAPANGLEASFVARDIFEFMLNEPYTGERTGTLLQLINNAFVEAGLPENFVSVLDPSLGDYTTTIDEEQEYTLAEVVQMCANAGRCVIYLDRSGQMHIEPLNTTHCGCIIPTALSYSHPEVELFKPLKNVAVSYGENSYVLNVGASGETQTVDNPLVTTEERATLIAAWVKDMLCTRKTVHGEYRADPRLDLFDVISVESKYGNLSPVAITEIKYDYSGSFKATYSGRVLPEG